jgi:hypothetical protein
MAMLALASAAACLAVAGYSSPAEAQIGGFSVQSPDGTFSFGVNFDDLMGGMSGGGGGGDTYINNTYVNETTVNQGGPGGRRHYGRGHDRPGRRGDSGHVGRGGGGRRGDSGHVGRGGGGRRGDSGHVGRGGGGRRGDSGHVGRGGGGRRGGPAQAIRHGGGRDGSDRGHAAGSNGRRRNRR